MNNKNRYGHRKRLIEKFFVNQEMLNNIDILELLLFCSIPRKDVKDLAISLNKTFGNNIGYVLSATNEELQKIKGLGQNTILFFRLIFEISLRIQKEKFINKEIVNSINELVNYYHIKLMNRKHEELVAIFLSTKNQILKEETMFIGSIDTVSVYPREIIKRCLELGASSIILLHNHPSGFPSPSRNDIELTESFIKICQLLNITFCDHIIIGSNSFYSFSKKSILPYIK